MHSLLLTIDITIQKRNTILVSPTFQSTIASADLDFDKLLHPILAVVTGVDIVGVDIVDHHGFALGHYMSLPFVNGRTHI